MSVNGAIPHSTTPRPASLGEPLCSASLNSVTATSSAVGLAVRTARTADGMSLRELARRLGVSAATLSAIENGHVDVSVSRLQAIAHELGAVSVGGLLDGGRVAPARPLGPAPVPGSWRDFAPLDIDPVLAAAITAFVDTGYHGATMRSIAARASMSVPGVYHHYASKQHLLVRIFDLTMDELLWRVKAARAEGQTSSARLELIVHSLALFHTHRHALAFLGSSEMRSLQPANRHRIAGLRTHIQRILDAEIADGLLGGELDTANPLDASRAISTMCTSLPQWFRIDGPSTPEQIATEYAEFALAMLGQVRG